MSRRISRRELFGGLAATTALVPLLNAEKAWAAGFPRRVLLVIWTNGMIRENFWPTGGNGHDLSTMKFGPTAASLVPYKSDLTFVRGMRSKNFADTRGLKSLCVHGAYAVLFTGTPGKAVFPAGTSNASTSTSESIDQRIAAHIESTARTPVRSLNLGMIFRDASAGTVVSYRGPAQPVLPEIDPAKVIKTLFSGMTSGDTLAKLKAQRRSMLDFLTDDLNRFGRSLGTDDKLKIESHLQSIRELEMQAQETSPPTCKGPSAPTGDFTKMENYPKNLSAQLDSITAAFRCNLTRVATLQLSNWGGSLMGLSFMPFPAGSYTGWHGIAHGTHTATNPNKNKLIIDTWFTEQFAAVIKRFKDTPEGGGSMLDNTAIVFANHMGDGNVHDNNDLPFIIAGKCGGAFKTGLNLTPPAGQQFATNALWVALANAMGLPISVFGDPKYGSGPLPGLMT